MDKINILDAALADKIAAGEVVERPASVVKELVENSIDAKATKIDIIILEGGKKLIEVRDNGVGMSANDAKLCIKRHATSKIKHDYDLFNINTMGFRGEALSAISSVSKFTLMTCLENGVGNKMFCLNSEILKFEPCALNRGSIIMVEELFYNIPARLKYLKSSQYEFSLITGVVIRLMLANPKVSFSLSHDGKEILKSSGKNDVIEIMAEIYGLDIAKNLLYFEKENYDFKISGWTTNISKSRANRFAMYSFMNGRSIKNKFLSDSIIKGYEEFLFENRYPFTVLYIEADPTILDVNIHPTKEEIRISKENELKELITSAIKECLSKQQVHDIKLKSKIDEKVSQSFFDFAKEDRIIRENDEPYQQESLIVEDIKQETNYYQPIGQIHGTYIIAQSKEGFILIDQHAAAERIRYENYKKLFLQDYYSVNLLIPLVIELPYNEFTEICNNLDKLKEVKIEAEIFGKSSLKITHVPYYLEKIDLKIYVESIINQLLTNKKIDLEELKSYAIATLACKASLKANSYLTTLDMEQIISDLFKCENPYTCPHGRPTMLKYSLYELQKAFKRV